MELQEVNINEARPLLYEKPLDADTLAIECPYILNGATNMADLHVTVQGERAPGKQALLTFHDIGMNHISNFSTLFNSDHMEPIRNRFVIYHIDAPGMQEGAPDVATAGFVYPSIENLSDMIPKVFTKFGVKEAVLLGCGLGANIFTRFSMKNPTLVSGLVLVNATRGAVGYLPWIGGKITNFATPLHDQLLNYHFSKEEVAKANRELVEAHRKHLQTKMNTSNVALLLREYERRTEINVFRSFIPNDPEADKHSIPCPTLLLVGDMSPFVEDVVELNSRLDPKKTTFLKMQDAGGMILEEQSFKVAEAMVYFLQGLGYIPSVIMSRLARSRTLSGCSSEEGQKRARTLSGGSVGRDQSGAAGDVPPLQKPIVEEVQAEGIIGKTSDKARLVTEGVC